MKSYLTNPLQSEENGIHIDICPKNYYPDHSVSHTVILPDGKIYPILYDGIIPYIPAWLPTPEDIDSCPRVAFTYRNSWDPLLLVNFSQFYRSTLSSSISATEISNLNNFHGLSYPISAELSIVLLSLLMDTTPILYHQTCDDSPIYTSMSSVYAEYINQVTSEQLSKMWRINLNTDQRIVKYTTHQCIRTAGIIANLFNTDKAQLWYKQLCWRHIKFRVDYLKVGAKYVRDFIGRYLYTNKLGFKKFFPCSDENSYQTGHTLSYFVSQLHFTRKITIISREL